MLLLNHLRSIAIAIAVLISSPAISCVYGQEKPSSKEDETAQKVPRDLKDWEITLSFFGGTPGDGSYGEVSLKSDGKLIVERGGRRRDRPIDPKKGETQLDKETLQKALELATAAIENKKAWRDSGADDGDYVGFKITSGKQSWRRQARKLSNVGDAAPELSEFIDLLNKQIKSEPKI